MRILVRAWVVFAALLMPLSVQAQPKDRLVIGMASFPSNMHPLIGGQTVRNYVLAAARRSVTRYDGDGRPMCQLCTELPSLENGRAKPVDMPDGSKGLDVTFTLRPGLRWGDGTPLTTRDILFGAELERMFIPRGNLLGVVAVDDRTYTVKLKAPRYDFQRLSPQPVNAAIEEPILRAAKDPLDYGAKSAFNRATSTPGLWNGPYLITGYKPNESVTFGRNPFWDGEPPGFTQVAMRVIDNTAALQANLLSGDVDLPNGLSFDQALDLQKRHADRFDVRFTAGLTTFWLFLQNDNPLLQDKRVRQAIMLAIDRESIVARVFDGKLPVANSIFPPADPNHAAAAEPWPYDPARARALLAEAGYAPGPDGVLTRADGTRLSLDLLMTAGIRATELLQQVIQSQLAQVGIEAVTRAEPERVLMGQSMRKRQFKAIAMLTDSQSPDIVPMSIYGSSGIPRESNNFSGDNYAGYSNPRVDAMLAAALVEPDRPRRQAILNDVQSVIMDELPMIPIYNRDNIFVSPKWMVGLTPPRSTYVAPLWIEYWKPR